MGRRDEVEETAMPSTTTSRVLLGAAGAFLLFACGDDDAGISGPVDEDVIDRSFAGTELLTLEVVSGTGTIAAAQEDTIRVHLDYAYRPVGAFRPEFIVRDEEVLLRERFHGSSSSGRSDWTVTVPAGTEVQLTSVSGSLDASTSGDLDATSVSGDLSVSGSAGTVQASTVSGDVALAGVSGAITVSTVSGNIDGADMTGRMAMSSVSGRVDVTGAESSAEISTTSGHVGVEDLLLTASSQFTSVSGDVEVSLRRAAAVDLSLITVSSVAVLDYGGAEVRGLFEFIARVDDGEIDSPFPFDSEEQFTENGILYHRKSFTRGAGAPRVLIRTASGTARLRP